ncbi:hypothetical protein ACVIWV_007427 [Bradyrhizobium diazoefficiens]|uniref:hypothetical protein n=1 Tax=Bradyrhizobium TaxID=374 RepID=UPI000765A323|nr:hypothetical protein [Bradyrhizobium diazoefficiens]MBR0868351.1 hypothetical protein [Bradyrhizobium diazoefficiens]MBR0892875.1 hypothetical protein [Bradyrhizobium diazoefficiens]MBR0924559.1 hypothetical protein [Bradyrhizobium diazoefficiens]WLA65827.1 hypothetical protein QNN01_02770 [Bradyrhizobium diazoefficiens]
MLVWFATAAAAIVICSAIYYVFAREQLFRLERYEYWSDRFFAAAKPLVSNPETPESLISLIGDFNNLITDERAPVGVVNVFRAKLERKDKKKSEYSPDPSFRAFFEKFPDLLHNAGVVSHAGLLAASYAHWVMGVQARAILADTFAEMELRRNEISDTADVKDMTRAYRGPSLVPLIIRR